MMSLVGCSGEQFQDILKSLGFRMQEKKVKRPAIAVSEPETPAEPQAVQTAETDPPPLSPEPDRPSPEPEAVAEVAMAAPPVETTEPALMPEAAQEEIEIEVWWPKDTGPFRHHGPKKPHRAFPKRPLREQPQGTEDKKEPRPERPRKPPPPAKPRRPEKPVDPDSPFAVLGALRERLTAKS
jgi:ATP-dependent RNA helicase SUPV3L1/SUV3